MLVNKAFVFCKVPTGTPVDGEHIDVQTALQDADAPAPPGGVFVKVLYASIDPYQRARMRSLDVKSYQPALIPGDVFTARSIAVVLRSDNNSFKPGDAVVGPMPIQNYAAIGDALIAMLRPLDNPLQIDDIRVFLSALGVPGLTAFGAFHEICKPVAGQTIFVSAASGAVGQMVGQLAKLEGLHVIGSAGSEEKADYLTSVLGFHGAFNYKSESARDALPRLAPKGIDIYFDNVGGEQLEAAICAMNDFGRVAMCGTISSYNSTMDQQFPLRSYSYIFSKRLTVQGFIVSDPNIAPKYAKRHQEEVQRLVKDGTITQKIWEVQGIENAPTAFLSLFDGRNFGKVVLKL